MSRPELRSYVCPITIGRTSEVSAIAAWLHAPSVPMLLLAGEPGIGKTRLCGEAALLAKAEYFDLLIGHCLESDTTLPFGPVREMLATLVARRSAEEIAAIAGPYASSLSMLLAEFAATNEPSDMALDRFSLYSALGSIFKAFSSPAPLLLIIEDLHWADSATVDFINWLVRNESCRSIRFLATYRPEDAVEELEHCLAGLERERCVEELKLGALDTRDLDRMLQATFYLDRPVPADLLHLLMSHTEGNPFFVEETLRSLAITRSDISSAGNQAASRSIRSFDAPRSVQDAVRLRTSRLSSTARHVLELAAVSGRRFDFDSIRELADLDEPAMIDALSELTDANLIVEETAEAFVFRHALTRQAVYNELLTRQRRTIHRQLAAQFKQRFEAGDSMVLIDLAYQAYAGGEWEDAIVYGDLAGQRAMELFAPRTAIEHFSRAVNAAEQLGRVPDPLTMLRRGTAHETVGEFDRALHDYEITCDLARQADNVGVEVDALLNLGLLWASNDYSRSGEMLERALDAARDQSDRVLEANCLNRIG
ncbi:MAG: AAA family ATPase, partial [Thermomicrobiales bacterium]